MAKPRTDVTIDSLLDRYINPVVERQKEREAALNDTAPAEPVARDSGQIDIGQIDPCQNVTCQNDSGLSVIGQIDSGQLDRCHFAGSPLPPGGDIRSHFDKLDRNVCDVMAQHFDPACMAIYIQLYRLSWGFQKADCTVTVERLATRACVNSRTARRTLGELEERGAIVRTIQTTPKTGNHYAVRLPHEIPELVALCPTQPRIATPDNLTADKMTDDKKTADRVADKMTDDKMSGVGVNRLHAGVVPTTDKMTADRMSANIEGTTFIENNNRDVVAVLQAAGYNVDPVKVAAWIARGVTPEKVQGYIDYIRRQKGKISNPAGWLITAVESGWVVEGAASQVAAGRDVTEQVDTEEQIRELERQRLAELMAELGPERLDAMRQEEREKCKHDPGYHNQPNERMRGHYIEALLRMRLLAEM